MDIKLHPDIKNLLEDLNARKRFVFRKDNSLRKETPSLRRGGELKREKLNRRDLEGRGGPM